MVVIWSVLALAVVFVIAAVVIGREARRLDAVPPRPVFDLEEAVAWVADHLPFEVSAVLSHEDVRNILDWNLEFFRSKAASGNGSSSHAEDQVVVSEAESVEFVLTRSASAGSAYTPAQVHAVLDVQRTYLEAIGAIGPEAPPDEIGG
jgi:hypothetical protein